MLLFLLLSIYSLDRAMMGVGGVIWILVWMFLCRSPDQATWLSPWERAAILVITLTRRPMGERNSVLQPAKP